MTRAAWLLVTATDAARDATRALEAAARSRHGGWQTPPAHPPPSLANA